MFFDTIYPFGLCRVTWMGFNDRSTMARNAEKLDPSPDIVFSALQTIQKPEQLVPGFGSAPVCRADVVFSQEPALSLRVWLRDRSAWSPPTHVRATMQSQNDPHPLAEGPSPSCVKQ
jgi:hypothetical protein